MIPAGSCCEKCYNDVNPQTLLFSFVFLDAAVSGRWFIPASDEFRMYSQYMRTVFKATVDSMDAMISHGG